MEVTALKKVLAISCLAVVLTITMAAMASAADNSWRFSLKADNGAAADAFAAMTIGVYSGTYVSKDGNYSDQLGSDAQDSRFVPSTGVPTGRAVEGVFGDMAWVKDVKSPRAPWTPIYGNRKVWDLRVAGMSQATGNTIRLLFLTVSDAQLPTPTVSGIAVKYWLKMVDRKGVETAPANGTVWEIPIPTVHSTTAWFTLTLPLLNTSGFTEGNLINEGYKMEFYQTPEPSSLMALGAGLMALGGLASRKRRK
jgi:hypothetical protein